MLMLVKHMGSTIPKFTINGCINQSVYIYTYCIYLSNSFTNIIYIRVYIYMFVNDQSGLVFLQMFLVQFWDGIPTMKSTRKLYIGFYGFLWKQGDHLISHKIGFNHQTRGLDPRTNRIQQQIICEKCWGYAGVFAEFNQQKSGVDQERGFHCRCYGRNKTCLSGNGGIDMDLQE